MRGDCVRGLILKVGLTSWEMLEDDIENVVMSNIISLELQSNWAVAEDMK